MKEFLQKILPWGAGIAAVVVVLTLAQSFGVALPLQNQFPLIRMQRSVGSAVDMAGRAEAMPAYDAYEGSYGGGVATKSMIAPMPPIYNSGDDITNPERSIVRSGSLEVLTNDVSAAIAATTDYVKGVKGLILQSSINTYQGTVTGSMSLKVPEDQFDTVMAWLQKMGKKVESLSVYSYDQTGQVTNTENQLEKLQAQLAEYQEQLKSATGIEKVRIQRQIDSLTNQIDSWQQQHQNLEEQAAMSQISVTYTKKAFALSVLGSMDLSAIVQQALDSLVALVQMLIMLLIWTVVFVPVWLPTVLIVKRLSRTKSVK